MTSLGLRTTRRWLGLAAWLVLAASAILMFLVLERAASAAWQWYKFSGYESPGIITLSVSAAWVFAVIAGALAAMGCLVYCLGVRSGALSAIRVAKGSIYLLLTAVALYIAVAFSPLNHWRP